MKVVLINPESPFLINQAVMGPLGLWYLSSVLKRNGHDVTVVDQGLGDEIPTGADVYGVTGTSAQLDEITAVYQTIQSEPGLKIIGGPHATVRPDSMIQLGFDTVVCHEGEEVINDTVVNRQTGIVTAPRIKNIDHLFPDRSQQHRYSYEINGIPATTMMTSRGCPYECAFCSKEVWGRLHVARSDESVVQEIDEVSQDYGAIMFYDDTLVLNRKRLFRICDRLADRNLIWRAFARSDESDYETLSKMKDSGCVEIGVGIESGSREILKNIHKRETPEDHRRCVQIAHEIGLRVKGFVIVGLPGETWQTIQETDEFLTNIQLDDIDISILTVYAGSAIFRSPSNYDLKFGWYPTYYKGKPGEYHSTVSTSAMSREEIVIAREYLHQKHKKGESDDRIQRSVLCNIESAKAYSARR